MRKITVAILIISMIFGGVVFSNFNTKVKAAETFDLSDYQKELDKINVQLGTDYCFPTEEVLKAEGRTLNDVEMYFQKMTLDEFHDYVYNAIQMSCNDTTENENDFPSGEHVYCMNTNDSRNTEDYSGTRSYSSTQKWFYSGDSNKYLFIRSTIYYADGNYRYSTLDEYGDYMAAYPGYGITGFSYSFSADKRTITCNFVCVQYIAPNIINPTYYNFSGIVFTANGGDICPIV